MVKRGSEGLNTRRNDYQQRQSGIYPIRQAVISYITENKLRRKVREDSVPTECTRIATGVKIAGCISCRDKLEDETAAFEKRSA